MEFTPLTLLYDFCIISALLFVAKVLRSKIRLLQNLYIPASLLAGLIGMFGGKYFLNIIPFSSDISSYSSILIALLFATLFLGRREKSSFKKMMSNVGDSFLLNTAAEVGQWGLGLLAGYGILQFLFPQLNEAFGMMMPSGFVGGHGTAAAVGSVFANNGWEEATTIGQTFATIGLLCGIFVGIILINIATRKGYTKVIKEMKSLPEEMKSGLVPEKDRTIMGENTVNPMSIDPFTWHLCLVLICVGAAYLIDHLIRLAFPQIAIPVYGLALICGVLLQFLLRLLKLDRYVDKRVITRIGSSATDYLVAFGVASININVVITYIVPILIMSALGLLFCILFLFFVSRKFFRTFWFERGIYIFGWSTGVMSIAVILLRIVDPEFQSGVLEDSGFAWIFVSIIDLLCVTFIPVLLLQGFGLLTGIFLVVFMVALIVLCGLWNRRLNKKAKEE